ncbi:MAG: Hsp20/alpha crystallin family protein [Methanomassiliicoccales archaeon]|nr:Hsp20/alpha crystallin family protein [Methanomassiliicoccales archaeon]
MARRRVSDVDDDIFTEFERLFEDIRQRMDLMRAQSGLTPESMPLSYSYRVVIDQDGQRKVTERYDDRTVQNKVAADDDGALVDVLDQEDKVRVIMHVPGASREDVDLECKDRSLMVKVENASRSMMREVPLPCVVVPSSMVAECRNGVLEVCLLKHADRRRKRKTLNAE